MSRMMRTEATLEKKGAWTLALLCALGVVAGPFLAAADQVFVSGALIGFPNSTLVVLNSDDNSLLAERRPDPDVSGYFSFALSQDSKRMFGGPSSGDVLEVVSLAGERSRETYPLSEQAVWIAPSPDARRAYVSTFSSLEVVDLDTKESRVILDSGFAGVAVSPDGTEIYAAFNGDLFPPRSASLVIVDAATEQLKASVELPPDFALLAGVTVSPDGGTVYVANNEPGQPIYVIDAVEKALVDSVFLEGTDAVYAMAFGPNPDQLFVSTRDGAAVVDTLSNEVVTSVDLDFFHTGIDLDSSGQQVYVVSGFGGVFVLDATTLETQDLILLPGGEAFNSSRFIGSIP